MATFSKMQRNLFYAAKNDPHQDFLSSVTVPGDDGADGASND